MISSPRKPTLKKMLLVVLPLLDVTLVESRPTSGLFAVVRRQNDFVEDGQAPPLFRRNRRSASPEYFSEEEEWEYMDYNHDTIIPSDERQLFQTSSPECTGRFAMEYEVERKMMRSAENPYIQRSMYGDNTDESINNNAHRVINPAAWFRSETQSETDQSTFEYEHDDSIFV